MRLINHKNYTMKNTKVQNPRQQFVYIAHSQIPVCDTTLSIYSACANRCVQCNVEYMENNLGKTETNE